MTDVAPTETASGVPGHIFISEQAMMMLLAKAWEEGREQGRMDAVAGMRMDFHATIGRRGDRYILAKKWLDDQVKEMHEQTNCAAYISNPWKD